MRRSVTSITICVTSALLLIGLPLLGVMLAGKAGGDYLEFPPVTRYVAHAPFSWPLFCVGAVLALLVILPFPVRVLRAGRGRSSEPAPCRQAFPWWGWAGVVLGVVSWVLAWTRFPWFAACQPFTFTPQWLAYILVVNALLFRRTGHCLLRDRPARFLLLFPLSAAVWWFFEYLNRFVQNWYYLGAPGLTPLEYFLRATLPFATVLPAVLGTYALLASFPRLQAGLDTLPRWRSGQARVVAWGAIALAAVGLAGIGVWPDYLFPLVWVAPLFLVVGFQTLAGAETVFAGIARGDWRRICLLGLAALVCGFFWEMWNFDSLARWSYTIPFFDRFHLFEMPILGYAGYVPFGLECAAVAELFHLDTRDQP